MAHAWFGNGCGRARRRGAAGGSAHWRSRSSGVSRTSAMQDWFQQSTPASSKKSHATAPAVQRMPRASSRFTARALASSLLLRLSRLASPRSVMWGAEVECEWINATATMCSARVALTSSGGSSQSESGIQNAVGGEPLAR